MKTIRILGGIAALGGLLVASLAAYLFITAAKPPNPVGFQQITVADPGHAPIAVAIWYPTDARPGFALLGTTGQRVATNTAVKGANLPLIIISHGTGGNSASHADTALALAAAGFVVAAPTHTGDNFRDDSIVGTSAWIVDRARHIGLVTDQLLSGWQGGSHTDAGRVGVFGFSAGATTALVTLGGMPDLERVTSQCRRHPEFVCNLQPSGTTLANPGPGQWRHDKRIKAAVIAAPGLGFSFDPDGLAAVTAPVQLWAGAADDRVPYATNAGTVRRLLPRQPEFHSIAGAGHLAFLAPCGLIGPPPICRDAPGFDRAAFHADFNRSVTAFFKANLAPQ